MTCTGRTSGFAGGWRARGTPQRCTSQLTEQLSSTLTSPEMSTITKLIRKVGDRVGVNIRIIRIIQIVQSE